MIRPTASHHDILPKYLHYEFWEAVPLRLDSSYTGGQLQTNQRAFFDATALRFDPKTGKARRIVGIEVMPGESDGDSSTSFYQGMQMVPLSQLPRFTLTILDQTTFETHKDIPIMDLTNSQNFGKIRVFDVFPTMEQCYVINTAAPLAVGNLCILFNFATVSW